MTLMEEFVFVAALSMLTLVIIGVILAVTKRGQK